MSISFEISFARAAGDWYLGAFWASTHYAAFGDSMSVSQIPQDAEGFQRGVGPALPAMESIE